MPDGTDRRGERVVPVVGRLVLRRVLVLDKNIVPEPRGLALGLGAWTAGWAAAARGPRERSKDPEVEGRSLHLFQEMDAAGLVAAPAVELGDPHTTTARV